MNEIQKQRAAFNRLVEAGVYTEDFAHGAPMVEFFSTIVLDVLSRMPAQGPVKVLDAGCGTGAWLTVLAERLALGRWPAELAGFDLSEKMVAVAQAKLAGRVSADAIKQGSALDPAAYQFPHVEGGFDLIVAFDMIQQLPPARQAEAVDLIVAALRPGGRAVIFDHDRHSAYGRKMARKKFVTRYLFLPLVPRYYCHARYPKLAELAQALSRRGFDCRIHDHERLPKLALEIGTPLGGR
ncbi:MAG: class I SAM-dependent methyltransferase [Rhodothalassiaceae bacterium]